MKQVPQLLLVILLIATLLAAGGLWSSASAQRSVYWDRYDVTIDVLSDGSMHITEDQAITFVGGPFSQGYAVIPLDRIERIDNIVVAADGQPLAEGYGFPGEYSVEISNNQANIDWWFNSAMDETRHFTISYDVYGAIRQYADDAGNPREQVWWRAIDADFAADVRNSLITINFPAPVDQNTMSLSWYSDSRSAQLDYTVDSPTQVQFGATNVTQGDIIEARVEFPKITSGAVPAWQARDDAQRDEEQRLAPLKAVANLAALAGGLLLLVGGTVGVIMLWFTRGRDQPVALPIDLLRAPPDDLPAGIVGTLIDEQADNHDVIAALVQLGVKGVIQIQEIERGGVLGALGLTARDFRFTRVPNEQPLAKHEQELLNAIFGSRTVGEAKLSSIREQFAARQGEVKKALYEELVKRGYFSQNPQTVRSMYRVLGTAMIVGAAAFGVMFGGRVMSFAPLALVPIVAVGILGILVLILGGAMPRKTQKGAEAAAQWMAFRRYLADIERYQHVEDAKAIFNSYLPYAIAFGLERTWVAKFASVNAPAPSWYGPAPRRGDTWNEPRGYPRQQGPMGGGPFNAPRGGGDSIPDLQTMSDVSGGGLQSMSDGLFDLFNQASRAFTSYNSSGTSSSGRGFSSGGFGGGFSGGGSFGGGGGGGGGRGFR